MTPLPLPLFERAPSAAAVAPGRSPTLPAGSVVRVEGLEGAWRVLRAGHGWVEVVGEHFRTIEAERVRVGRG